MVSLILLYIYILTISSTNHGTGKSGLDGQDAHHPWDRHRLARSAGESVQPSPAFSHEKWVIFHSFLLNYQRVPLFFYTIVVLLDTIIACLVSYLFP